MKLPYPRHTLANFENVHVIYLDLIFPKILQHIYGSGNNMSNRIDHQHNVKFSNDIFHLRLLR